jgi:hypothetical protein
MSMHQSPTFTQRARRAAVIAGIAVVAIVSACKNPAGTPEGVTTNPLAATYDSSLGIHIADYQVTTNGAYTLDSIIGGGAVVNTGKLVKLRYTGFLTNGVIFDKNTNVATDSILSFTIGSGSVIQGFDEGLIGMRQGGKRMIIIPPTLGYGSTAHAGIPANSILVFSISLTSVQ